MIIERTDKEIVIRIPGNVDIEGVQKFINYIRYKELTSGSKVEQQDADYLANKIDKNWWLKNKDRFIK